MATDLPKTPEALAACHCAGCDEVPECADPLPKGWTWDTLEPDNRFAWCPRCNSMCGHAQEHVDEGVCDSHCSPHRGAPQLVKVESDAGSWILSYCDAAIELDRSRGLTVTSIAATSSIPVGVQSVSPAADPQRNEGGA